jgi:hypothetical protein
VHLAHDPTRVYSKDELLREVSGFCSRGTTRTVTTHVSRLRQALALAGAEGWVSSVWGVGYRLAPKAHSHPRVLPGVLPGGRCDSAKKCIWFSDHMVPSIHGEPITQASTLSEELYPVSGRVIVVASNAGSRSTSPRRRSRIMSTSGGLPSEAHSRSPSTGLPSCTPTRSQPPIVLAKRGDGLCDLEVRLGADVALVLHEQALVQLEHRRKSSTVSSARTPLAEGPGGHR